MWEIRENGVVVAEPAVPGVAVRSNASGGGGGGGGAGAVSAALPTLELAASRYILVQFLTMLFERVNQKDHRTPRVSSKTL